MARGRLAIWGDRPALVAVAAAALLVTGCSGGTAPPPPKREAVVPVAVAIAQPAVRDGSIAITGTVRLKRETALGFNAPGRIAEILVREGDRVAAGTVLARLDPTSLAAASASARAEAARADADFQRLSGLYAKGWVTAPRVETARAAAAAARARVAQSGFDVGLATIRAPSSGVVLRRAAEPGQITSPGQTVLLIGEIASGYVLQLPLADADLSRLRIGQPATVTIPAFGTAPITATVAEIGARGDDGTGTFRVRLALPPLAGLRSGLIGSARLPLAGNGGDTSVRVPATAVFSARADEGFVFVHDATTGRARLRQVAIGPVDDTGVTITRGVAAGEPIITSGPDRLRDGMRVTVIAPARG
jgi:RND family efflux transporter MFP subunit